MSVDVLELVKKGTEKYIKKIPDKQNHGSV